MQKGYMNVTNYTECASSPGTYAKSVMRGKGDPGYLLTSSTFHVYDLSWHTDS